MSQHRSSIDLIGEIIDSVAELVPATDADRALLAKIEAEMRTRWGGAEAYVRKSRPRPPVTVDQIRPDDPLPQQAAARLLPAHPLSAAPLRGKRE